jgi:pyruvate dehydrogenase E2 component (dihydrolipoamide acetyltransferase)
MSSAEKGRTEVVMPQLSDSMEQGTILTWLIADGAAVSAGQELVEIETDKATMTYEAEIDGTLEVVVAAGTTVAVGEVIARLGDGARAAPKPGDGDASRVVPEAENGGAAASNGGHPAPPAELRPAATPAAGHQSGLTGHSGAQVLATPMARRIAAEHGIAVGELRGSGPRGRVVRADVQRAAGIEPSATAPPSRSSASAPAPPTAADGDERVTPSRLQALIARRMAEAKATVPHFQVQTEVEMTAALQFRAQLKAIAAAREQAAPSLNDLIVKACALALRSFPRANGSYLDGGFTLHARVNVGVAVAAQDALIVPVVHDADTRTLGEIATVTRELAAAVRDGTVTAPQLSGATFTVSNLGMFGMTAITPVIDPPQAAILGVGTIRDALGRDAQGAIVDRRLLTLTLSCDHRILYGADAARLLAAVRDLLQAPAGLAL